MSTRTASSWIVLAMWIAGAPVSAQSAEAEALFRQGRQLMKDGKTAEACDKFDAAERLEPSAGTELNLGKCREDLGQTARAWAAYKKAVTSAKRMNDDDERAEAEKHVNALEPQLVYLTIQVPLEHDVDGLVIKRNDAEIDRALWDQKVPVDPDEYTISAQAPGRKTWTETVMVKKKDKVIEVPKLDKKKKDKDTDAVETPEPKPAHARKYGTAMWTLAAGGAGALALGTGLALYANNVEGQADALCPNIKCGDPHAVDLNQTARLDATLADVAWGLGGAALVGAVALYFAGAPSGSDAVSVAPVVGRGRAGLAVGGRF